MIFGLYLFEHFLDLALFVDQKGRSMNTHVGSSHKFLLTVHAIRIGDRMIRIG